MTDSIRTEPQWGLLTTFSVNLLNVTTHQHGPKGPHYLTHDQAVNMLHACINTMAEAATFPYLSQTCWCWTCDNEAVASLPEGDIKRLQRRMNLCPDCGNKRCPRATDHALACSGSNDPGQEGSRYPAPPCRYCGRGKADHQGPYCM